MFLSTPPAPSRGRSRLRTTILVVVATASMLAIAALVLAVVERGRIPSGTSIAGVDVGGKTPEEATAAVKRSAAQRVEAPISLGFPDGPATISGTQLGATPRIEVAVERASDAGVMARMKARLGFGEPRRIALAYALAPERVTRLADELDARVAAPATDADVTVTTDGTMRVEPATSGALTDRGALAFRLRLLPPSIVVPIRDVPPLVSTASAERARRVADRLLTEPRSVVLDSTAVELGAQKLRKALRFEPGDGGLSVRLDEEVLGRQLRSAFKKVEGPARDASFRITASGSVIVVPAAHGRELDVERIANSLVGNLAATAHRAKFVPLAPSFTTEEATKLKITELVSEFTTYYSCCAPRVTNIQRAAALLDGTVLAPREQFSLNDALGQRTVEKGFVSAPQIRAGRLEDSVGGGISQVATTLFNAAFFAGLRLDEHQAHQFYISRYPMGREATVSWRSPELIFTNDWSAGLLMKVSADDGSITVRFYSSTLGRRVETVTEEPYSYRAPTTNVTRNKALAPGTRVVLQDAGASGFTVQFTREVYRGEKRTRDERYTVRYDPQNSYVEEGPPKKPAKPKKPKPGEGAKPGKGAKVGDPGGVTAPSTGPPKESTDPEPPATTTPSG